MTVVSFSENIFPASVYPALPFVFRFIPFAKFPFPCVICRVCVLLFPRNIVEVFQSN